MKKKIAIILSTALALMLCACNIQATPANKDEKIKVNSFIYPY